MRLARYRMRAQVVRGTRAKPRPFSRLRATIRFTPFSVGASATTRDERESIATQLPGLPVNSMGSSLRPHLPIGFLMVFQDTIGQPPVNPCFDRDGLQTDAKRHESDESNGLFLWELEPAPRAVLSAVGCDLQAVSGGQEKGTRIGPAGFRLWPRFPSQTFSVSGISRDGGQSRGR